MKRRALLGKKIWGASGSLRGRQRGNGISLH